MEGEKIMFLMLMCLVAEKKLVTSFRLVKSFIDGRSTYLPYLCDSMLEEHGLFHLSIQQLRDCIVSGNGNSSVSSAIPGKCKNDDDYDSLASLKKSGKSNAMINLGTSIQKHGASLVAIA